MGSGSSFAGGLASLAIGYVFTVGIWYDVLDEGWELWKGGAMLLGCGIFLLGTWLTIIGAAKVDK